MKYEYVSTYHPICSGENKTLLTPAMKKFWASRELFPCNYAILAYDKEKLVGFLRFDVDQVERWLYGAGTYIDKDYRKQGLAFTMWARVIRKFKPKHIEVITTSPAAEYLVSKLERTFPKIEFPPKRI